jgi:hypothetical protein
MLMLEALLMVGKLNVCIVYAFNIRYIKVSVRHGPTGLYTWRTFPMIGDGTWPTPHTSCNYS